MRFLYAAALASSSLLALACGSTVIDGDDDGAGGESTTDCGLPPPAGDDGWCPPSWQCIDGKWQDTAGACPEPTCPAAEPSNGDSCPLDGMECEYFSDVGECLGEDTAYVCMDGAWVELSNFCSPPQKCPELLPVDGSDCTGWDFAFDCTYEVPNACGIEDDFAYVNCDGAQWSVDMKSTCNDCVYGDAASCEANAACRWLVPGCGENPLPVEGCAPIADCAPDSCAGGATCSSYDADPCWNTLCNACSGPVSICEMIFDGGE